MAWTGGLWPVAGGDAVQTQHFEDLRTELNLRHGTAVDAVAFSDGDSTWDAITRIRGDVEGVVEDFFDYEAAKAYTAIGVAGGVFTVNIWYQLYGGTRKAWLNVPPATESATPNWDPLEQHVVYIELLNELYDVIDRLGWRDIDPTATDYVHYFNGIQSVAVKQTALDNWWAGLKDYFNNSNVFWNGCQYAFAGGNYQVQSGADACGVERMFQEFTIPADAATVRVYQLSGNWTNEYDKDVGGSLVVAAIPYDLTVKYAIDTVDPDPFDTTVWDYGADVGTLVLSGASGSQTGSVELSSFTAGAVNYLQTRVSDDDSLKPQWIVDSGYWGSTFRSTRRCAPHPWGLLYRRF